MNGLLALLFTITLIAFVVAMIIPGSYKRFFKTKSTRKHLGFSFGSILVVLLILVGITAPPTRNIQVSNAKAIISEPAPSKPHLTTKTTTTTTSIPFTTTTEENNTQAKGSTQVKVQGVEGTETQIYKVTYKNNQEISRELVSTNVTTPPVTEVIEVGTYVAPTTPKPVIKASTPAPKVPKPVPNPAPASCHPLTNGGNCYEPGEFCRSSDHELTGVAGDGKAIICTDNNGWRWEPI